MTQGAVKMRHLPLSEFKKNPKQALKEGVANHGLLTIERKHKDDWVVMSKADYLQLLALLEEARDLCQTTEPY